MPGASSQPTSPEICEAKEIQVVEAHGCDPAWLQSEVDYWKTGLRVWAETIVDRRQATIDEMRRVIRITSIRMVGFFRSNRGARALLIERRRSTVSRVQETGRNEDARLVVEQVILPDLPSPSTYRVLMDRAASAGCPAFVTALRNTTQTSACVHQ
jgi:hypothetical protein